MEQNGENNPQRGGSLPPKDSLLPRSQLWLSFSFASKHIDTTKKYNEQNPGAGLEVRLGPWSIVFGAYKNSHSIDGNFHRTMYGGIEYKPLTATFGDLAGKYPRLVTSACAVAEENGFDLSDPEAKIRYGLGFGYVTGYITRFPRLPLPVIIGTFDFEKVNVGFNVLVLPYVPYFSPMVFGFRGKIRFDDDELPGFARQAMVERGFKCAPDDKGPICHRPE